MLLIAIHKAVTIRLENHPAEVGEQGLFDEQGHPPHRHIIRLLISRVLSDQGA